MFFLDGTMNFSLNERIWSFASSDFAYSSEFASAGNVGLTVVVCSIAMDPMMAVIDLAGVDIVEERGAVKEEWRVQVDGGHNDSLCTFHASLRRRRPRAGMLLIALRRYRLFARYLSRSAVDAWRANILFRIRTASASVSPCTRFFGTLLIHRYPKSTINDSSENVQVNTLWEWADPSLHCTNTQVHKRKPLSQHSTKLFAITTRLSRYILYSFRYRRLD